MKPWGLLMQAGLGALLFMAMVHTSFALEPADLSAPHFQQYPPELIGQWVVIKKDSIGWHRSIQDHTSGPAYLQIEEQNGAVLEGFFFWQAPPGYARDHNGIAEVSEAKEPIIGLVEWDGRSVTFVEHPDTGTLQGKLLHKDMMQLMHFEPGPHATIARYLLIRQ